MTILPLKVHLIGVVHPHFMTIAPSFRQVVRRNRCELSMFVSG